MPDKEMTAEQKAAFVNSQVMCANIEIAGMITENQIYIHEGKKILNYGDHFFNLVRKYRLDRESVERFFNE